ncbi:MAG: cupin [Bacteroidetes bacterium]|nr:MAG: cupin [Bacteroidota bacterium]
MKTANLNQEKIFNENRPAVQLMFETDNTKELRILMKKGQEMEKHQTSFPIVVHLVSGAIDFEVENTTHPLASGAMLSLNANVPHSLFAKEESVIRLSLSKQDSVNRVKTVAGK